MAQTRSFAVLALCVALAGCSSFDWDRDVTTQPSARAGLGGPGSASGPVVSEVGEVIFRTPSKNINCALKSSEVRCDIGRRSWTPPPKPADCQLDWGNGLYVAGGKAGVTCAGDTLIGSGTTTLEYGTAYRSGDVLCDSESAGLTCKDEKSGHGFTLAVAGYGIF